MYLKWKCLSILYSFLIKFRLPPSTTKSGFYATASLKVNAWVSDCGLMPSEKFFSYIMARTSYIQWEDNDACFVLNQHTGLYFVMLAHWNNSLRVDMSLHSDTLSWFRAKRSLLFLLNALCLVEKQQILIL